MRQFLMWFYVYFGIKPTHEDILLFILPWLLVWTGLLVWIAVKLGRIK